MKQYSLSMVTTYEDEALDDQCAILRAVNTCKANTDISYITITDKDGNLIAEVTADTEV